MHGAEQSSCTSSVFWCHLQAVQRTALGLNQHAALINHGPRTNGRPRPLRVRRQRLSIITPFTAPFNLGRQSGTFALYGLQWLPYTGCSIGWQMTSHISRTTKEFQPLTGLLTTLFNRSLIVMSYGWFTLVIIALLPTSFAIVTSS